MIDEKGEQVGVIATTEALGRAQALKLDLVEVSPNVSPPVCKIMDFGRYKFELSKKSSSAKKKQKKVQLKEIKFRPGTDVGDFDVKLRKVSTFLERGDKVKITIRFRGREMAHKELGMELMTRVKEALAELAVVDQEPKFEGRQMMMMLSPSKK